MATAKKTTEKTEDAVVTETVEPAAKAEPATVRVMIYKNDAKEEDQVIGINGKFDTIKRGAEVDIPASHAEILRHSQEMRNINRKILETQK